MCSLILHAVYGGERIHCYNFFFCSEISYELHLRPAGATSCFGVAQEREGIEFAMRGSSNSDSNSWVPLQLHYFTIANSTTGTKVIRGHTVRVTGSASPSVTRLVLACGSLLRTEEVQFRWMGTAYFDSSMNEVQSKFDVWALSNVTANLVTKEKNVTLFEDLFGSDVLK